MDSRTKRLSLQQVKELDMVEYLSGLGYQPEKIKKDMDYWYLSPLRIEGEPSFKINRVKNRWFDFGLGKGGNLIDFGLRYFNCTVRELLDKINVHPGATQAIERPVYDMDFVKEREQIITILNEKPLFSYPLINYLHERGIPIAIANQFCCEVAYEMGGRNYYGIGFKNDAGGYEIRNAYVKQSSSPKDITTFGDSTGEVHVFEGFMDFLSWQTMQLQHPVLNTDFIILNGAAFFEKARPVMEQHETIRLWLDRDTTGKEYTKFALSLSKNYHDESSLYSNYKDLNDWLSTKGSIPKKQLKQKIEH
jgi:DNA primase